MLGTAILVAFGHHGFNPTDEGFVNAASYRLLSGQWPHSDFIWPRPAGSAYLHAPELLLPFPQIMTSRAIALAELIGYSILFAVLVIGRRPTLWGPSEIGLVAVSVLVNHNTWPFMTLYTIDGLMLITLGAVLLRSAISRGGHSTTLATAFFVLGVTTLTKQSFWPAPLLALIWLVAASPRADTIRRLAIAASATVVAPLAYLSLVWLSGGLPEMLQQLAGVRPVFGIELATRLASLPMAATLGVAVACLTVIRPPATLPQGFRLVAPAIVTLIVAGVIASFGLVRDGGWGAILWWLVAVRVTVVGIGLRRIDWPGMVLLAAGWMATLSYGLAVPNLVAGSLGLYLITRAVQDATIATLPRWGPVALATLLAIAVVPTFATARSELIYRDRPAGQLTAALDGVGYEFSGVVTNPVTAEYLVQVRQCIRDYPAARVAIIPDNPGLYPALNLRNPFPIDWMIPVEMAGSEARVLAAAAQLTRERDYLVLIQPVAADRLATTRSLDSRTDPFRDPELGDQLRRSLAGTRVSCGSFSGVWSP